MANPATPPLPQLTDVSLHLVDFVRQSLPVAAVLPGLRELSIFSPQ